jgi:hypothetical protein
MRSARQPLIRSGLKLLACGFLITIFFAQAEAAAGHKVAGNVIRVWTVGSPFTNDLPAVKVPPELQRRVQSLGYTIEVEAFRPIGFADKFRKALQDHNEPEILTFNNYGVLLGVNTPTGWIPGIASDPATASLFLFVHESLSSLQDRGWVVLIRSASNHDAARALSLEQFACDSGSTDPALRQAQETAASAARAYLACDQSTLAGISDESRLGQKCFYPESETQVESVKVCRVSGNRNLAFASLVTTFSSYVRTRSSHIESSRGGDLGQQSILVVLRNSAGVWRLLAITDDPMNTVSTMSITRPMFERFLADGLTVGAVPEPARLLIQDGMYPVPPKGERFGDFAWEPGKSKDAIGQVVEFIFETDNNRRGARLFFLSAEARTLSSGYLIRGGRSVWRVWSISKGGDVVFSEQRTFIH